MSYTSSLQGVPLPDATDADNVPYWLAQGVGGLENRVVMRFTSTADRDAKIPSPVRGMVADCGTAGLFHFSTAWVRLDAQALPDALRSWSGSQSVAGAAATWLSLPTVISLSITFPQRALVNVAYSAWAVPPTGQSFRVSAAGSGATVFSGTEAENLAVLTNAEGSCFMARNLIFAAGTTTVELRVWKSTTATVSLATGQLQLTPLRWIT